MQKKKKAHRFLLFLKIFSWETDLWVTLGNFMVKNVKIAKGILYLTENWLSRNEKDLDSNFNLVTANINFF